ncbi:MAG: response regulator [Acidobacteriota bacterium]
MIADDDALSRRILEEALREWGHEVTVAWDGEQAWSILAEPESPRLAILDWIMPGLDGVEVCRRTRRLEQPLPHYLILLTSKGNKKDVVQGFDAGADDYITKPFDCEELRARVQAGARILELQAALSQRARELEETLSELKRLEGLLPICSYCKKIRNDRNYWQSVESYLGEHSEARFTHGICPDCYETTVRPQLTTNSEKS